MKLVLAEKLSVAMSLSKVIGANQRGDGGFSLIRLHRVFEKSKRTVGSPARTTKVRLRGQREIGGFLLNLLCKDESPDVP